MSVNFITIILIFILNVISNCLGTLKTIFISKQIGNITYIITAIDALFFSIVLKAVSNGSGVMEIIAYCLGKVVGAIMADVIENKYIALGTYLITIYPKQDKVIMIADDLRELGYTVNTSKQYGMHGKARFAINITIARKEINILKNILEKKYNINSPNMIVEEIKSFEGKINTNARKVRDYVNYA